ncbi:DUF4249 domain-containing protein [Pedobacter sp. Du54]|uniref:DUF4249 domain-containing protein n=1 Tax=Pedobacter anseongensis TaxID=3133439 RepID=UPI0030B2EF14
MRRKVYPLLFLICAVAGLQSCKDSFNPEINESNNNLLIVEGFINTGADSTLIKLNRSVLLADQKALKPEVGATVSVVSETNEVFLLPEIGKGIYAVASLQLNAQKKYRLKIKTAQNSEYQSDLVEVKESPAIDEVNWKVVDNGLQVYVNTHDASNKTRYYRWEYTDTWIFRAAFESHLMWDGAKIVSRNNNIYQCWGNASSSTVLIGSTAKLQNDVVFQSPITLLDHHAERLGEKYSILVKQYAITKEAYQFYEELKKNTENLGSIFDAQPSEIKGNIHNVNRPYESVIGYIGAGTVQKKRIFISKNEIPTSFFLIRGSSCTEQHIVEVKRPEEYAGFFASGENIPIDYGPGPGATFYTSGRFCADCTLRGTNKKPDFWQ